MDRTILEKASEQGIISQEQVKLLLDFDSQANDVPDSSGSEEQLRFVRSFGDIFITLGIIFVAIATAQLEFYSYFNLIPIVILVMTTEWLVRVRRLALPGIALLIATLYFSTRLVGLAGEDYSWLQFIIPTVVAFLFYLRYRMPFTLLAIALGVLTMVSIILGIELSNARQIFIIYGLLVFAVAMWFDSRDVARLNVMSDGAFWLHLLAAPLMVHGVMVSLLTTEPALPYRELFIIIFFVAFFLVALYVDRRAILVSSVSYAIYAIVELAKNNEIQIENMTLLIFIGFGVFIIIFGVYWYKIRAVVFKKVSNARLSKYVPAIDR